MRLLRKIAEMFTQVPRISPAIMHKPENDNEAWARPPLQVCPLCGLPERAMRAFTARCGFFGKAQVKVQAIFTSSHCPKCAVKMVRECGQCKSVVKVEHATCCWYCGRAYSWARLRGAGDWRHSAEVIKVPGASNISPIVWLYVGDITNLRVDGIVSPDDYMGRMRGEVASRILRAAGDAVGSDVGRKRLAGEAWQTTAGNLTQACFVKHIIHVAAMQLDGTCDEKVVKEATRNALATVKELNLQQLAFPAIGTGSGKLEMEVSVPQMLSAIKEFSDDNSQKLLDIICVVLEDDRAADFKKAADKYFRGIEEFHNSKT